MDHSLCASLRSTTLPCHESQSIETFSRWRSRDLGQIGPVKVLDVGNLLGAPAFKGFWRRRR